MTGSGKTHMMFGDIYNVSTGEAGVAALTINELFSRVNTDNENSYDIKMSYLEIYNEYVKDLLSKEKNEKNGLGLLIVEDPIKGVVVPELTEYKINSVEDLLELTLKGNQVRTMAETKSNQFSSRSHAIISIIVESEKKIKNYRNDILISKFLIVDLAGSERAAVSDNKGLRMREGGKINRSLLALGNCINMLSTKHNGMFIPYRDSKLTRLLKDSLGGNTKTVMIACVSPGIDSADGTINTLKYAQRAKRINKVVIKNVKEVELHIAEYKKIIDSLKAEIANLKIKLEGKDEEISHLRTEPNFTNLGTEILTADLENIKEGNIKISSELLSKLEEQCEMKQSLIELNELSKNNKKTLIKLQESCDKLNNNEVHESGIINEINELKENMAKNDIVQKQIEDSLECNIGIQHKLLSMISDKSSKNNSTGSVQVSIRTLTLEKSQLQIQNLKLKEVAKEAQTLCQEKDKEIERIRKELENAKQQLSMKDLEINGMKVNMKFKGMQNNKSNLKKNDSNIIKPNYSSRKMSFNYNTSRIKSPKMITLRDNKKNIMGQTSNIYKTTKKIINNPIKSPQLNNRSTIKYNFSSPKFDISKQTESYINKIIKTQKNSNKRKIENRMNGILNRRYNRRKDKNNPQSKSVSECSQNPIIGNNNLNIEDLKRRIIELNNNIIRSRDNSIEPQIITTDNKNYINDINERSISLNSKVNALRDRRRLLRSKEHQSSLEPMKEIIKDISSKLHEELMQRKSSERSSLHRNSLRKDSLGNTTPTEETKFLKTGDSIGHICQTDYT